MTRKHFIAIADVLASTIYEGSDSQHTYSEIIKLCRPWTDYLATQNTAFNSQTFVNYVWEQYSLAMGFEHHTV